MIITNEREIRPQHNFWFGLQRNLCMQKLIGLYNLMTYNSYKDTTFKIDRLSKIVVNNLDYK